MTPDAIRQKKYRSRAKCGALWTRLDMPYSLACLLIDSGYLTEAESYDPERRGNALLKYLKDRKLVTL